LRETLTRVLRTYGLGRGESAAGLIAIPAAAPKTDCDFDPDAWDRGEQHMLGASGIGRVVLSRLPASRLPAMSATRLPLSASAQPNPAEPTWRAVIDLPQDTSRASLAALHAVGVRGVRIDPGAASTDGLDALLRFAERIVPFGWHIEFKVRTAGAARTLAKAEWRLMQFPLAVCFSGLGGHREPRGTAEFDFLLGMVQLGRYWLKLSANDLAAPQLKLWDEPPQLAHALQAVRKDRLIWGSGRTLAGDGAMHIASGLALLDKCLPHPGDQQQVLVDNPARLYDF
jgi:predicted TIM-barrel fold metal-dependent hydrolase